jgi:hypothetical protein
MTRRAVIRTAVVVGLLALGWVAGRAQAPAADFTLRIEAPMGETKIECVQGCALQFIRETPKPESATPSFTYGCTGQRCGAAVHGFLKRQ